MTDPLKYKMNKSLLIASICMGLSIRLKRVKLKQIWNTLEPTQTAHLKIVFFVSLREFFYISRVYLLIKNKDNNNFLGSCILFGLKQLIILKIIKLVPQTELTRVNCIHLYFTARAKTHYLLVCKLTLYPPELPGVAHYLSQAG